MSFNIKRAVKAALALALLASPIAFLGCDPPAEEGAVVEPTPEQPIEAADKAPEVPAEADKAPEVPAEADKAPEAAAEGDKAPEAEAAAPEGDKAPEAAEGDKAADGAAAPEGDKAPAAVEGDKAAEAEPAKKTPPKAIGAVKKAPEEPKKAPASAPSSQ